MIIIPFFQDQTVFFEDGERRIGKYMYVYVYRHLPANYDD